MENVPAAVRRDVALADVCSLLAIALDRPTRDLARGVADGSFARDAAAMADELGVLSRAQAALDELGPLGREHPAGDSIADVDGLYARLRREHTRLFEHPVEPAVYPFEGQFLYAKGRTRHAVDSPVSTPLRAGGSLTEEAPQAAMPPSGESGGLRRVHRMSEEAEEERPRLFVNPAALDAERCYRAFGLRRSTEKNVPADSIVTEIQFMAYLYTERARACVAGDDARARHCTDGLEEFGRLHTAKWMKAFFDCCAQASRVELYRFAGLYGAALLG